MVCADQVAPLVPPVAGGPDPRHEPEPALHRSRLLKPDRLRALIAGRATALGFDALGVAPAAALPGVGDRLSAWLAAGCHGDMLWLAEGPERRASPAGLWPDVRSVILLGVNYGMDGDPMAAISAPDKGSIALYARRKDYHDTIKGRLKELAGFIVAKAGGDVKVFVDTAPVMEKPLAAAAGLGWQGKSSLLISRDYGTWLFLGAIYTTLDLAPDAPQRDLCGSCTKCLDACPTAAFPEPYVLDARRCLAYLTIEFKGVIPQEFRAPMGNRIFGCDDCLAVCPWNKFASNAREAKLALRPELMAPDLAHLAGLDDAAFRLLFAGTPVKRTGRDCFVRNVLIAIGNSGNAAFVDVARARLDDPAPLVRGMAVWALSRLMSPDSFQSLARPALLRERDEAVIAEWRKAGKPA